MIRWPMTLPVTVLSYRFLFLCHIVDFSSAQMLLLSSTTLELSNRLEKWKIAKEKYSMKACQNHFVATGNLLFGLALY